MVSNYFIDEECPSCGGQCATNGRIVWCTECGKIVEEETKGGEPKHGKYL